MSTARHPPPHQHPPWLGDDRTQPVDARPFFI